jgi:predicted phosphoadenosine phosphosulfate sulfurtransferase
MTSERGNPAFRRMAIVLLKRDVLLKTVMGPRRGARNNR